MSLMPDERRFHHIGCAVRDLEASLVHYRALLGSPPCSRVFDIPGQHVRVCFVELSPGSYLELIEGGEASPVGRYLAAGFYHLCFLVDDLDAAVASLVGTGRNSGWRPMPAFDAPAFGGHRLRYIVTPELHLVEFAEMAPSEFADFFARNVV